MVSEDTVIAVNIKFKNYPSVKLINSTFNNADASFCFQYLSLDKTSKEINKLNPKKVSQGNERRPHKFLCI